MTAVRIKYGGRHDHCNASAPPMTQAEGDTGEPRRAVDGSEGGRPVFAVVIADQRRHDHHQQRPSHARQRGAGERHGPRRAETEHRDAAGDRHRRRQERLPATEPVHDAHTPDAGGQGGESKRRSVQGCDDAGQVELLAQLTKHDPDAEPADEEGVAEGRGVGEPIPPELVGVDDGRAATYSFVPVKRPGCWLYSAKDSPVGCDSWQQVVTSRSSVSDWSAPRRFGTCRRMGAGASVSAPPNPSTGARTTASSPVTTTPVASPAASTSGANGRCWPVGPSTRTPTSRPRRASRSTVRWVS